MVLELMPGHCRRILQGIRRYAHLHGRQWRLQTLDAIGLEPIEEGRRWLGDGIIAGIPTVEAIEVYRAKNLPFVNISSAIPAEKAPSVVFDNRAIGRLAAEHLLNLALRDFAFCGDVQQAYARDRLAGFEATLRQAGHPCPVFGRAPLRLKRLSPWRQAQQETREFLSALPRPCGVFACDDNRALMVAQACDELRLRIPEDLALLGANDDDLACNIIYPPLSSIDISPERLGECAAAMLDDLMRGRPAPRRPVRIAPRGVVARQSTDLLAVGDPRIADAVRFIRTAALTRPLRVAEVCKHLRMPRRTAIARFRQALGRSPKAEITRVRLARVEELLTTTDWSIKRIAYALGFANPEALARAFHTRYGIAPSACRRKLRRD